MIPFTCPREKEVADLLHRGHWPQACPQALRAHVHTCRACSDLVFVAAAFQAARAQSAHVPRLESPGALWWRAQLRRRSAAIERIGKPILGAQIFALAVALVIAAGAVAWQARQGLHLVSWLVRLPQALNFDVLLPASWPHLGSGVWLLVPVLSTIALLGGVVVYLASERH
jgi:hypothetical protein